MCIKRNNCNIGHNKQKGTVMQQLHDKKKCVRMQFMYAKWAIKSCNLAIELAELSYRMILHEAIVNFHSK